jgi:hypothetical protein
VVKADSEEMERLVSQERLTVLKPELNTEPHVYYKNLQRFDTCFIAGSVAYEKDGLMECAEGARVHLEKDGSPVAAAKADVFGDFKIDGIRENSGTFQVEVSFGSVRKKQLTVEVAGGSVSLGTIVL